MSTSDRRLSVHGLVWAVCCLVLGTGFVLALAEPGGEARKKLQGAWIATQARRDRQAADDVVGHRLVFEGERFQILSGRGELLHAGTVRLDETARPAAIDFELTEGAAKGKTWKGIFKLEGETLIICDIAPDTGKPRPAEFEAKSGSGYVLITFKRGKP
jgi:uncharacterized protein (TIGR03067 family)